MIANPVWPEIQQALRPGEKAVNRPDLVARVFRMKWKGLLDMLCKDHVLGKVNAYTW